MGMKKRFPSKRLELRSSLLTQREPAFLPVGTVTESQMTDRCTIYSVLRYFVRATGFGVDRNMLQKQVSRHALHARSEEHTPLVL